MLIIKAASTALVKGASAPVIKTVSALVLPVISPVAKIGVTYLKPLTVFILVQHKLPCMIVGGTIASYVGIKNFFIDPILHNKRPLTIESFRHQAIIYKNAITSFVMNKPLSNRSNEKLPNVIYLGPKKDKI